MSPPVESLDSEPIAAAGAAPRPRRLLYWFSRSSDGVELAQGFGVWMLGYLGTRDCIGGIRDPDPVRIAVGLTLALLAVAALKRFRPGYICLALVLMTAKTVYVFPHNANHQMLEWLILVVLVVGGTTDQGSARLSLGALRWMVVGVFFWAGIQKVLYGTYFDGAYLATRLNQEHYRVAFEVILGDEMVAEIMSRRERSRNAPFTLLSTTGYLVSNLAYLVEIILALVLLAPRMRGKAAVAAMVFVACVEAIALELMFGLLTVTLLTLFSEHAVMRRLRWLTQLACWGLVCVQMATGTERLFN